MRTDAWLAAGVPCCDGWLLLPESRLRQPSQPRPPAPSRPCWLADWLAACCDDPGPAGPAGADATANADVLSQICALSAAAGLPRPTGVDCPLEVVINSPSQGSAISNFVLVNFTGTNHANSNALIYEFDYSTNGGLSYRRATDFGGGSVFGNPSVIPVPAGAQSWEWDTSADIRTDEHDVAFRITVRDATTGDRWSTRVVWDVLNQASCSITAPAQRSTLSGQPLVSLSTTQPSPNGADLLFEYSTDGGATFSPATDGGGGSISGNPVFGTPPGARTWQWNTGTDIPGSAEDVIFRLTVTDAVFGGGTNTCERVFDVNNAAAPP